MARSLETCDDVEEYCGSDSPMSAVLSYWLRGEYRCRAEPNEIQFCAFVNLARFWLRAGVQRFGECWLILTGPFA